LFRASLRRANYFAGGRRKLTSLQASIAAIEDGGVNLARAKFFKESLSQMIDLPITLAMGVRTLGHDQVRDARRPADIARRKKDNAKQNDAQFSGGEQGAVVAADHVRNPGLG
jgi:hypothetical protein